MATVLLCIGVAVLAFAFGVVGLLLEKLLPEPHTSDRSRDMIGTIVGLISLLLALVLGTLIGSAYSFYATQKSARARENERDAAIGPRHGGRPGSPRRLGTAAICAIATSAACQSGY